MSSWYEGWQNIFVNTNNTEDPYTKLQFCSVAEPYHIQKRISLDDVIYMNVFTNYGGDPAARAARRKARIEAELQAAREKQRAAEQEAAAAREAQRAAEQKARIFGQQNQQIDEGKIQMMRNAGHSVLADHVISEVKQGRTPYYYGF
jgi:hypothetical protein